MKNIISISLIIIMGLSLNSCSKEKLISRRVKGFWTIDVYQKSVYGDGSPILSESNSFNTAGSFEFDGDGNGRFNILKDLGEGTYFGNSEFQWTNTDETISIRTSSGTKTFQIIEGEKDRMVFEREVKNFYFSGNDHDVVYEMDERITLIK